MAKFQVTGTVTFRFDVDIDAKGAEGAEEKIQEMSFGQLAESAGLPTIGIDSVNPIRRSRKAAGR